jgi:hypothetical protein
MSFPPTGPRNVESGEVSPETQPGSVAAPLAAPPPPAPSTSDSSPEQTPEDSTDWFRAAFQNMRAQQYGAAPGPSPEAPPASVSPPPESKVDGAQTAPVPESMPPGTGERQVPKPPKRQSESAPSSEDFSRAVQSEVDRRLDKFNREEAARRQREQETRQREQERYLRDTDPHEFARLVREREQEQAATQQKLQEIQQFATEQITTYDRHVLDPLMKALPDSDQREILSHVDPGLEGRGKVTSAALAALKKVYTDQGRQSARQALMNDQVFIKEILTRYGGGVPEPVSTQGIPAPSPDDGNMNTRLRAAAASSRNR